MIFFVPGIHDQLTAAAFHVAAAERYASELGKPVIPARTFAIRYRADGREFLAQVGIEHPPGSAPRVLMAILPTAHAFILVMMEHDGRDYAFVEVPRALVSDVEYFNQVDDSIRIGT